jgi:hypothetical protein
MKNIKFNLSRKKVIILLFTLFVSFNCFSQDDEKLKLDKAYELASNGKYDEAIALYSDLIDIYFYSKKYAFSASNYFLYEQRAFAKLKKSQIERIKQNNSLVEFYKIRMSALADLNNYLKNTDDLNKGQIKSVITAHNNKALILSSMNCYNLARAELEISRKLDENEFIKSGKKEILKEYEIDEQEWLKSCKKKFPGINYGVLVLENTGNLIYFGEINDGKPINKGELFTIYYDAYFSGTNTTEGWLNLQFDNVKIHLTDGNIFEGKYYINKEIEGKMTYPDGAVFTGSFFTSGGYKKNKGTMVYKDGSSFKGFFNEKDGTEVVNGLTTLSNGDRFITIYHYDRGTYVAYQFANGAIYIGYMDFQEKFHSTGQYIDVSFFYDKANNIVLDGEFKNGKLIKKFEPDKSKWENIGKDRITIDKDEDKWIKKAEKLIYFSNNEEKLFQIQKILGFLKNEKKMAYAFYLYAKGSYMDLLRDAEQKKTDVYSRQSYPGKIVAYYWQVTEALLRWEAYPNEPYREKIKEAENFRDELKVLIKKEGKEEIF